MVTQDMQDDSTVSEKILKGLEQYYGVEKVFGDPIEDHGMTVIPVAKFRGGGGGGAGSGSSTDEGEETGTGTGEGGGFGLTAEPAGVYVITADGVEWQPAIDRNKMIVGGTLSTVAICFFGWLTLRAFAKR